MIIDTSAWTRKVLDLSGVPAETATALGVQGMDWLEYWKLGKKTHLFKLDDYLVGQLQSNGAKTQHPGDEFRVCNNCGKPLLYTGKQQAFGKLYKCPGCSVAWWGKPTSLPANAETRNARRLTANMMKLVKDLAPSASLKHDVRPLGCLNLQECRIEAVKLTDLNASEKKRRAIIHEAVQQGILNSADRLLAEELVDGYKSINGNTISKISADQCNHNWGWIGIDETCTHCGITKKALLFGGGQEVESLKQPQDLYDDAPDGWLAKALSNTDPLQMKALAKKSADSIAKIDPAFCHHSWDFSTNRCKLCGITKRDLFRADSAVHSPPVQEPKPARLIDLE